jgi:hypothetical protein
MCICIYDFIQIPCISLYAQCFSNLCYVLLMVCLCLCLLYSCTRATHVKLFVVLLFKTFLFKILEVLCFWQMYEILNHIGYSGNLAF